MMPAKHLESAPADLRQRIPHSALRFRFARSSGPGGQNVNKVSTRVTLLFDLDGSEYLDEEEKRRIRNKMPGRISNEGVLRVVVSRHRTQQANRQAAIERFYELLSEALAPRRPRKKAKIPAQARRRRLEDKRRRGELKRLRRNTSADGQA
jgi:ribosome-associated protein